MSAWTKERPTRDGFYWIRVPGSDDAPDFAEIRFFSSGVADVIFPGQDYRRHLEDFTDMEWQGPITPHK